MDLPTYTVVFSALMMLRNRASTYSWFALSWSPAGLLVYH